MGKNLLFLSKSAYDNWCLQGTRKGRQEKGESPQGKRALLHSLACLHKRMLHCFVFNVSLFQQNCVWDLLPFLPYKFHRGFIRKANGEISETGEVQLPMAPDITCLPAAGISLGPEILSDVWRISVCLVKSHKCSWTCVTSLEKNVVWSSSLTLVWALGLKNSDSTWQSDTCPSPGERVFTSHGECPDLGKRWSGTKVRLLFYAGCHTCDSEACL